MRVPACKLSFCFVGFTEHGFISCDCAISGGVNIAGSLFKKANDLKCVCVLFPFLFHLNYLQKTGLPKHRAALIHWLFFLTFPFCLVICGFGKQREKREGDKDASADLGPREEGEMSRVQPGRGQGAMGSLLPSLLPELVSDR